MSFMLIYAIDSTIHSLTASYAIVGASLLLAAFIVYKMRQKLIFRPTVNFLAKQPSNVTYTLEDIIARKQAKRKEILQSKECLQTLAQDLFAPNESKNKLDGLMQHVNMGIAAYDGIMTGIKILRRVRGFFDRKRRTRK